jgi:hypothetical protein
MLVRVTGAAVCLLLVSVAAAGAMDGGSGTYTSTAGTYDFNLFNGGTTAWQYFIVVGTAATRFVGGTTGNEGSARCVSVSRMGRPTRSSVARCLPP